MFESKAFGLSVAFSSHDKNQTTIRLCAHFMLQFNKTLILFSNYLRSFTLNHPPPSPFPCSFHYIYCWIRCCCLAKCISYSFDLSMSSTFKVHCISMMAKWTNEKKSSERSTDSRDARVWELSTRLFRFSTLSRPHSLLSSLHCIISLHSRRATVPSHGEFINSFFTHTHTQLINVASPLLCCSFRNDKH